MISTQCFVFWQIMSGIKYSSVVKSEDADGVLEVKLSKEAFIETSYKKVFLC